MRNTGASRLHMPYHSRRTPEVRKMPRRYLLQNGSRTAFSFPEPFFMQQSGRRTYIRGRAALGRKAIYQ